MDIPSNSFKQQVQDKKTIYGIWQGIRDSYVSEICAGAGFDWICIDAEHSPMGLDQILNNLRAIEPTPTSVIVRPPTGDTVLLKQLLDMGVQNFVIPMVETAQQAAQIVKALRYGPEGIRGVGLGIGRAGKWGRVSDYIAQSDGEICLIVQVENERGVENLESIVNTPGVDGVFIGPADLSVSMGFYGKLTDEVLKVIKYCLGIIRDHDKTAGILTLSKKNAEKFISQGANMVGVGIDSMLLADATSKLAKSFKKGS